MMAVSDDQLQAVKESFEAVLGDLEGENVGIIIALPLKACWGVGDHNPQA